MAKVEVEVEFFMKKPIKGTNLVIASPKPESRKSSLVENPINGGDHGPIEPIDIDNSSRKSSIAADHVYMPLPPRKKAVSPPPKADSVTSSRRNSNADQVYMPLPPRKAQTPPPADDSVTSSRRSSTEAQVYMALPVRRAPTPPPEDDSSRSSRRCSSNSDHVYVPLPAPRKAVPKDDPPSSSDIDEHKLMELQEAFLLFDINRDGIIDKEDLLYTYQTLGVKDVDENEILTMLSEAESPLDFANFAQLLGFKRIELDSEETLIEALSHWDDDDSGLISEEQIRHDLMTWGDKFSQKEVDVALEDAPVYIHLGKAMIDYIKFCKALCGLRKKT